MPGTILKSHYNLIALSNLLCDGFRPNEFAQFAYSGVLTDLILFVG